MKSGNIKIISVDVTDKYIDENYVVTLCVDNKILKILVPVDWKVFEDINTNEAELGLNLVCKGHYC